MITLTLALAWLAQGPDCPPGARTAATRLTDPDSIEARLVRATLPNAMRVALLPQSLPCDSVIARITLRFGDAQSLAGRRAVIALLRGMLDRGTRSKNRQGIRNELERLRATAAISGSVNRISLLLQTTRPYLLPVLRLAAELLQEPQFDTWEFEALKAERLATLQSALTEPRTLAEFRLSRILSPYPGGHPLAATPPDEEIRGYRQATLAQVREAYARLLGGSNGDVAISGAFAPDSVLAVLRERFGGWRSPTPFRPIQREFFDLAARQERLETPGKPGAVYLARQNLRVAVQGPDHAALELGNFMLGDGFSRSRFARRFRADSVGREVGSGLTIPLTDGVGTFTISALVAPEDIELLESAVRQELDRIRTAGFRADEVTRAKREWVDEQRRNRMRGTLLVVDLSNLTLAGLRYGDLAAFERRVAGLTAAAVNAAVRRYLDPARLSVVEAGDFRGHPPR